MKQTIGTTNEAPLSYNIATAIALTGLSRTRLYELIAAGRIEARQEGTKKLVIGESLRGYVKSLPSAAQRKPDPQPEAA